MVGTTTIKYKSVFVPGIARRLLKMGHPIYDIKPKKENPDASIFIFAETEEFKNDFVFNSSCRSEEHTSELQSH